MSPDSQRLEIEHVSRSVLHWLMQQPDCGARIEHAIGYWLQPALVSTGLSEKAMAQALVELPQLESVHKLLLEQAFGMTIGSSSDKTSLYPQYLRGPARRSSGLQRRYLRRLAGSCPGLWRVSACEQSARFSVRPLAGGAVHTLHDREAAGHVSRHDVLIARLIPLPAGPVLGAGLISISGMPSDTKADSPTAVSALLSDVVLDGIMAAPAAGRRAPPEGLDAFPPGSDASSPGSASSGSARPDRAEPGVPPRGATPASGSPASAGRDREKLLERVRKLFAMAQESEASPHEAEIALRRCQSLMAKYGISEADLETSAFATVDFGNGRTVPTHLRILAAAVADLHQVLFVTGRGGHTEFRGYEVDAHVARLTLEYLLNAVERALKVRKRAGNFPPGRSAAYDYRLGFSDQVEKRIDALVHERAEQERRAAGSGGTALAIRKLEIVERECGADLSTSSFKSRAPQNAGAHAAGRDDGARVSLDKQVGGASSRPALPRNR